MEVLIQSDTVHVILLLGTLLQLAFSLKYQQYQYLVVVVVSRLVQSIDNTEIISYLSYYSDGVMSFQYVPYRRVFVLKICEQL